MWLQRWYDAFLRWDPEEYEGAEFIFFPAKLIWSPELYLYYRSVSQLVLDL